MPGDPSGRIRALLVDFDGVIRVVGQRRTTRWSDRTAAARRFTTAASLATCPVEAGLLDTTS